MRRSRLLFSLTGSGATTAKWSPMRKASPKTGAQQVLADARTVIVEGAGHGFYGEDRARVEREATAFVQGIVVETGPDMRAAA